MSLYPAKVKARLSRGRIIGKGYCVMNTRQTLEDRLAAKLRENLRRRKQQARLVAAREADEGAPALSKRDQDG